MGIVVPQQRAIVKKYSTLSLEEVSKLINSKFHECRLTALLILVKQFEKGNKTSQREIVKAGLRAKKGILMGQDKKGFLITAGYIIKVSSF